MVHTLLAVGVWLGGRRHRLLQWVGVHVWGLAAREGFAGVGVHVWGLAAREGFAGVGVHVWGRAAREGFAGADMWLVGSGYIWAPLS